MSSADKRKVSPFLRLAAGCLLAALALLGGCAGTAGPGIGSDDTVVPKSANDSEQRRRARIRLELAAGYYQQKNYSVALDELRQALTIDPNYAAAYGMLGLVYMSLREDSKAEQSFAQGLKLMPDSAELNNNYGWYLCSRGKFEASITYFEKALKDPLYQTPSRALHNAGICMRRAGDDKRAQRYLLRAFQIDATNPVAMYNLAEIYLKQKDLDRAHFYAQRLVTSHPATARTLWLALRVQRARGDRDGEASLATQLRRRFPGSPEADLLSQGRFD
ncbi:MAG: type IV pilus biogenesis/stability protein PilW [Burkholderiaceae bacterium]|nr:type IV pilus biogenesis/stability protein PilW [Burkholderiaceae bacterium]